MYAIAIDIGTNSTRAALFNEAGALLHIASRTYPLHCPQSGYAEQNPLDWKNAVTETVRSVLPEDADQVKSISLSTQGGSTTALRKDGNPLRTAITWLDMRSEDQAARLLRIRDRRSWYESTGVIPSPHYSICQILWMREREPEIYREATCFATTSDYINRYLTGRCVIDPTNALMTGMLSQETGDWDDGVLRALNIPRERLPAILPSGTAVGTLRREAAEALGLPSSCTVYNGVHDQYACAVGSDVIHEGDSMLSCGTAWALLAAFRNRIEDKGCAFVPGFHVVRGMRGAFYALSAGSQVLNRTMEITGNKGKFDEINRYAAKRIEKNRDLFFYPYLAGSVGLDGGARAKGSIRGMDLSTDAYDLALAAMEGVAFEIVRAVMELRENGLSVERIKMLGGASRSDLWADILSAVSGMPVLRPGQCEAALMGAGIVALHGAGCFQTIEEACQELCEEGRAIEPDEHLVGFYGDKLRRYLAGLPKAFE